MDQYGFKLISHLTAKCQISWAIGVFKLIIDSQWITIADIRAAAANLQFVRFADLGARCRGCLKRAHSRPTESSLRALAARFMLRLIRTRCRNAAWRPTVCSNCSMEAQVKGQVADWTAS